MGKIGREFRRAFRWLQLGGVALIGAGLLALTGSIATAQDGAPPPANDEPANAEVIQLPVAIEPIATGSNGSDFDCVGVDASSDFVVSVTNTPAGLVATTGDVPTAADLAEIDCVTKDARGVLGAAGNTYFIGVPPVDPGFGSPVRIEPMVDDGELDVYLEQASEIVFEGKELEGPSEIFVTVATGTSSELSGRPLRLRGADRTPTRLDPTKCQGAPG